MNNFYSQTIQEVFGKLNSNEHGLTNEEAKKRLFEFGPNKFAEAKVDSIFSIFIRQFKSPLIYIYFLEQV